LTAEVLFGVTGATGEVGRRVAQGLAPEGAHRRLIVRDPSKVDGGGAEVARIAGYDDRPSCAAAFADVTTLFLVSASEHPDRVGLHKAAIDAAVAAGVERIVYLSFLAAAPDATFTFARDHYFTEEHIRASGVAYTFVRNSLYADYVPYFCGRDGVIRGPAGDGRFAPIARDDIAAVVVSVLGSRDHDGETLDNTGPALITMADAAAELERATGRAIAYVAESLEEARASRAHFGAPEWEVEGWVTSYAAIATGEMAVVSDTVERLTGRPAMSVREYLERHPESYAHLKS
jgi:NAD(P)H dehydrogenase (quinone)